MEFPERKKGGGGGGGGYCYFLGHNNVPIPTNKLFIISLFILMSLQHLKYDN